MTARAMVSVQYDPFAVHVALGHEFADGRIGSLRQWPHAPVRVVTPDAADQHPVGDDWLRLDPDEARALYEALAEHYGHTANDVRQLRKDYDHERRRVDLFLKHTLGERP